MVWIWVNADWRSGFLVLIYIARLYGQRPSLWLLKQTLSASVEGAIFMSGEMRRVCPTRDVNLTMSVVVLVLVQTSMTHIP